MESERSVLEQMNGELAGKSALCEQIDRDLLRIQSELTGYSKLIEEVQRLQAHADVLNAVKREYAETTKELRAKVIPQARMIINQILPTLTNGRYSDFDISEDLKFTVYAVEAKQHKAREFFSGGTQDQFLIALRLAFTQSILDSRVRADKYCLLLDECISSSDEARRQGIFDVLELMKGTLAQILIIAHEDISNFVDHHLVMRRNARGYAQIQSTSWTPSRTRVGQQKLAADLGESVENS
jgi:exonuclease SbcC